MKGELSDVEKGYAAYTNRSLRIYDRLVHGFSNRFIWRCPTQDLVDLYRVHLSTNHLDVGPGTGFFLEKTLPEGEVRIALLDANRDCLEYAAKRIEAARPELHQKNILESIELPGDPYDSIGLNYLFHCLPGRLEEKAALVFDNLAPYLHPEGTMFGSTILGTEIQRPFLARWLMSVYNKKGIFCNVDDSLGAMMEALSKRFRTFNVEVQGCVVLFWGKGLRDSYRESL
jgi:2-polyprenyl-3-methyl-5-hydroxy-6-metoxy-1,4-benzoquinol methylase